MKKLINISPFQFCCVITIPYINIPTQQINPKQYNIVQFLYMTYFTSSTPTRIVNIISIIVSSISVPIRSTETMSPTTVDYAQLYTASQEQERFTRRGLILELPSIPVQSQCDRKLDNRAEGTSGVIYRYPATFIENIRSGNTSFTDTGETLPELYARLHSIDSAEDRSLVVV